MKNLIKSLLILILIPSLCFAGSELRFTVTNNSQSAVIFSSTDWLDTEQHVMWHQTKHSVYYHPPKNMYVRIASGIDDSKIYSSFYVKTDPSCDRLGLPPMRQLTGPIYVLDGQNAPVRYKPGIVHVTIDDAEDSSIFNKHLKCHVDINQ